MLARRGSAPRRSGAAPGALALALALVLAAAAPTHAEGRADEGEYWHYEAPEEALEEPSVPTGHIVLLNDAPPAVYAPSLTGAFEKRGGGRFDAGAVAAVGAYSASLRRRQFEVLATVGAAAAPAAVEDDVTAAPAVSSGAPRLTHHFTVAVNGFAAAGLTDMQAAELRARPDVLSVSRDARLYPHTYSTAASLGLKGPGKLWHREFGEPEAAAVDVLVGIIDTGIDSSHPSFAAVELAGASAASSRMWPYIGFGTGACGRGNSTCTAGKLLACRYHEGGADFERESGDDFVRSEDDVSTCFGTHPHGTHVASTVAGHEAVMPLGAGLHDQPGGMSGMAPGAKIASYKIIWTYTYKDGTRRSWARESDTIAAVEQAIKDGVDVINYSVGGPAPNYTFERPVNEAFKGAAAAGIFVAASAGNSGPRPGTLGSNGAPWVTTVASGTHPRRLYAQVTISAPSSTPVTVRVTPSRELVPVGPAPVYFAGAAAAPTDALPAAGASAKHCAPGSLPRGGAVEGRVVVCVTDASVTWQQRAAEVKAAGGAAMLAINPEGAADDATYRLSGMGVPMVHASSAAGRTILAALRAAPGALSATLSAQKVDVDRPNEAPFVAPSSSRGPVRTDRSAVLKPDMMAPGVDVFAAVPGKRMGAYMSGTSMASPHVAGVAALIRSRRPRWSPAAIKSALMTTASLVTNRGNTINGTAFDYGAGFIDPSAALSPGLVYDSGSADWTRYSCALADPRAWDQSEHDQGTPAPAMPAYCEAACKGGACERPQALRDLNLPSISLPGLEPGDKVAARRAVTYVGGAPAASADDGPAAFAPELSLPAGFAGEVRADAASAHAARAAALAVRAKGKKAKPPGKGDLAFMQLYEVRGFEVRIAVSKDAPAGWSFGSLTWRDTAGRYAVRSPIAIEVVPPQ